jgi:hypothetical protein
LLKDGKVVDALMVSESGLRTRCWFTTSSRKNRHLRQWLSNEVVPMQQCADHVTGNLPSLSALNWAGVSVPLLHYQHHAWIKWRTCLS